MNIKWLIYCRVSTTKQVKNWSWLSSQEKRCRDYAANILWVEVEKVFSDEWVSGWLFERKSIQRLFKYIDSNKKQSYTVIFEDLNRLSRDIQVHALLKSEFKKRGVELACPNFQFEESPEWDFKENISVVVSQYEKDKNKQRVIQRMKARMQQGFWCFKEPIGYRFIKSPNGWKIMIKDTNTAPIIKTWLERYADGMLNSLSDLLKYLQKRGITMKWITESGEVYSKSCMYRIATNILYTGYLECKKWDIWMIKAQHEPIISMDTFDRIQSRMKTNSPVARKIEESNMRKDISADFPLRWFLYCEESWNMFSWAWCQWSHEKFPYYTYPRKSPMGWKSINRDTLETTFTQYLRNLTPKKEVIACFEKIFLDTYKKRKAHISKQKTKFEKQISQIDTKMNNYIERIGETTNPRLVKSYEKKIEMLEKDKSILSAKLTEKPKHLKNVWTNLKQKLKIASNALLIRNSSNLENKRKLLKLIFPEGIPINTKRQVWTPTLSLIYQAFGLSKKSKCQMVQFIEDNLNDILYK